METKSRNQKSRHERHRSHSRHWQHSLHQDVEQHQVTVRAEKQSSWAFLRLRVDTIKQKNYHRAVSPMCLFCGAEPEDEDHMLWRDPQREIFVVKNKYRVGKIALHDHRAPRVVEASWGSRVSVSATKIRRTHKENIYLNSLHCK